MFKCKNLTILFATYFIHRTVGRNAPSSSSYSFLFFIFIYKLLIWFISVKIINVIIREFFWTSKVWNLSANQLYLLKICTNQLIHCSNTHMIINTCMYCKISFLLFVNYDNFIFSFIWSCLKFRRFRTEWLRVMVFNLNSFLNIKFLRNNWFFFYLKKYKLERI
jgi:hypothetical protein